VIRRARGGPAAAFEQPAARARRGRSWQTRGTARRATRRRTRECWWCWSGCSPP